MFVTLCVWETNHVMLWVLGFCEKQTRLSMGSLSGGNYYFVTQKSYNFSNRNWGCHWSWAQTSPHSEFFAPLSTVVKLTATLCFLLLPMAGFEKLALRNLRNCVFLPDLTLNFNWIGVQSTLLQPLGFRV